MVEKDLRIYVPDIIIDQSVLFLEPPDRINDFREQIIFIMFHIFQNKQFTDPFDFLVS